MLAQGTASIGQRNRLDDLRAAQLQAQAHEMANHGIVVHHQDAPGAIRGVPVAFAGNPILRHRLVDVRIVGLRIVGLRLVRRRLVGG